tara:strand:+ start:5933 stop:6088 length:156 start_codon:yes stop_codon:yes gene_type:complete
VQSRTDHEEFFQEKSKGFLGWKCRQISLFGENNVVSTYWIFIEEEKINSFF